MDPSNAPVQTRTRPETGRAHRSAALTAALLVFTLAGCGGGDSSAQPTPPPSTRSSDPTTATSTPAPPVDGWRDDFTADQLTAYDQALKRFDDYEQRSEPIWAAGKATPEAEALFKQYFPSPLWTTYYQQLQTYQASNVQVSGLPTVLSSKATAIGSDSKTVTIEQCVDYTTSTATQNGSAVPRDSVFNKPVIRTLQLDKPDGHDWLVYQVNEPTPKKFERCDGTES